jgi:beta-lactam-binding protein with PASTA domain/predicted Ser/Thr protein kinase
VSGIARDTLIDDRYKVVSRLGTGGMADVFLVEDQQLGRKVALKLLHRRFAEDPAFVERFRREAQAAAGLQHVNIVGVYDRGEWDGTYYIAMEYLPGRTLKEVIQQEAPLDPVRAIDIAIQILRAARFAHRRGIIHRDLKPHNVIVDAGDDAKVTDFGIARAGASDMTETGSIMGTAQYLSPEQARGHSVTASSDLYSVGVVLYEMLTGRVPFDGEQAVTIALKHVSEAPIPPRQIVPGIPPELEQTVLWTLNKNAADRPADADQLITVLEHCRAAIVAGAAGERTASMAALATAAAAGMPIEGLPPLPPPVSQPTTNGSGQMAVLLPADAEPEPEPERRRGWRPWLWGLCVLVLVCAAAAAAYLIARPKQVLVPSVTGETFSLARTQLQNEGFTVNPPFQQTSAKPAGTVVAQKPDGRAKADQGSAVQLTLSKGRGTAAIPSVQGETRAKATATLKDYGLKVGRTESESSTRFPSGQAIGTNPGAGQSVPRGTPVVLILSTGVPSKPVPNVGGKSLAAATAALQNAGFRVTHQTEVTSAATPGDVIAQDPTGGTTATAHSVVTLTVAKAPAAVTVPRVTGDPTSGAESALQAEGFHVVVAGTRPVSDPTRVGTVVSQSPPGSSRRPKGTTVTIIIGSSHGSTTPTSSTSSTTPTTRTTTSSSSTTTSSSSTPTSATTPANGTITQ